MHSWKRRTAYYLTALAGLMLVYTVLYRHGMRIYEGDTLPFVEALQFTVETFTATGYGSQAGWESAEMNVLVIVMDLTGVVAMFMALPVLIVPLFENAMETSVPTEITNGLSDHVVVATYTPRAEALISELDSRSVEYVLVEPDREVATDLFEDGYSVIHGDPDAVEGLEAATLTEARALVADVSDQVDASIVLTAREVADDVPIVSVVEDPDTETYHRLAGADEVLSPRVLLGESLASKVTTAATAELGETVDVGEDLEIAELPVHRGSPLVGRTLVESAIREETGANVIGAWFRGEFESPPSPAAVIDDETVLLVTGRPDQLEALNDLTHSEVRHFERGKTVVAGYGQVGRTIAQALEETEIPTTVVDIEPQAGVDVVGDVTEPETLEAAGIDEATTVILALPDDTTTEFATLVVRDASPETEVVARVQGSQSIQKLYRAGADYVLSLATVSGRMIASAVLENEEVISLDKQVDVVRTTASGLTGKTIGEANVRARTGCTVVGVGRDGEVHTDVGPRYRVREGDELIVAGTDEGTNRFAELFS